jgi:hypothetical protein
MDRIKEKGSDRSFKGVTRLVTSDALVLEVLVNQKPTSLEMRAQAAGLTKRNWNHAIRRLTNSGIIKELGHSTPIQYDVDLQARVGRIRVQDVIEAIQKSSTSE